jgi:hypothetical protein
MEDYATRKAKEKLQDVFIVDFNDFLSTQRRVSNVDLQEEHTR